MTELKQQTTSAISDELESFLRAFKDRDGNYKYFNRINDMMASNSTHVVVDYIDLDTNKPDLTKLITDTPDEMFDAFNKAVYSILKEIHYDYAQEIKDKIKVRIGNYSVQKGLREINAEVINKLISVPGMVVRTSEIKPLAKKIAYACLNCNTLNEAQLKGLTLKKPMRCTQCSEKELEMDPENSYFTDFQLVRLQELPEDLPAGQLPHYVEVTVMDDLVDRCRPGDRVLLTGIVRIEQEQTLQIRTSLFRLRMEGNNIEYLGGLAGNKDGRTVDRIAISSEDEKQILSIAGMPDAYDKLIASFAPHIYGHEVIKESILLLIVGSVTKKLADGSNRRGDINIFLVGDPGTAKSEMLKFAAKIAPRGLYTSGRGTTAAGLTAAVIRDKSGIMMLEAGAVVLGDQGLVCIDEFDKIKSEDRSALHEVMEQQTCSVAKGGIVATLNARTSILAAGNPKGGKYDINNTVAENIEPIPIPLLTRFDLIHIVRDTKDAEFDKQMTDHILKDMQKEQTGVIDIDLLRKYLVYTKRREPTLNIHAINLLGDYYMKMRALDTNGMITVTARQLEGLIRLATARARLLLKNEVDEQDAERAIYLVNKSLETIGINVSTGEVTKEEKHMSNIQKFNYVLNTMGNKKSTEDALIQQLVEMGISEYEAKDRIQKALELGQLHQPQRNVLQR